VIRVVIDTNILVSGFLYPGGAPSRVVNLAADGAIRNTANPYILAEFGRILTSKFKRQQAETEGLIGIIKGFSDMNDALFLPFKIGLDANDVPILACALEASAELIVTGDKKMLAARLYKGVRFVTAAEMLAIPASKPRRRS
jgi:uncharacterized protein